MFVLGHVGIGKKLAARPYRHFSRIDKRAFFVGVLLPDLIDKPLYYGTAWLTGKRGAAAGIISGTHLFAHTGLFLVVLTVAALMTRSRPLRALAMGVATHLALDFVGLSMDLRTLLWPLRGWRFPSYPFRNLAEHLGTILNPVTFIGEALGAAILWSDHRKARRRPTSEPTSTPASSPAIEKTLSSAARWVTRSSRSNRWSRTWSRNTRSACLRSAR
jgi:hypothetical protein